MNLFSLKGKVTVVIGGTGQLGGALAEGFAAAGAAVAIFGRNAERGKERVSAIRKKKGDAIFVIADAMSPKSLRTAHLKLEKTMGPVDILVNAAGGNDPLVTVTAERAFHQIKYQDWLDNFNLNLVGGVLFPCQEFGPAMISRQQGSIINIASVSAHVPLSKVVSYSASKAAVLNLTQFLAREWAPHKVRVNSITPGFFPAEQNQRLLFDKDGTPSERAKSIMAHTAMGRFGRAEELVGAAVFLASEKASSFVTGTDIRVDGGFLSQTI